MFEIIILGVIQGLTEFLPVSSSAHLVISERLFNLHLPGLSIEVTLHLASLLALIYYFNTELWDILIKTIKYVVYKTNHYSKYYYTSLFLITATLTTALTGIGIEFLLDEKIKSITLTGLGLIFTGVLLIIMEKSVRSQFIFLKQEQDLNIRDGILIGICQGISVIPGISRSGFTIVSGIFSGYSKETAVKLSFLLAFPVIIGSFLYQVPELISGINSTAQIQNNEFPNKIELIAAFITSFVASLVSIKGLISLVKRQRLTLFAIYVFSLGLLAIISDI